MTWTHRRSWCPCSTMPESRRCPPPVEVAHRQTPRCRHRERFPRQAGVERGWRRGIPAAAAVALVDVAYCATAIWRQLRTDDQRVEGLARNRRCDRAAGHRCDGNRARVASIAGAGSGPTKTAGLCSVCVDLRPNGDQPGHVRVLHRSSRDAGARVARNDRDRCCGRGSARVVALAVAACLGGSVSQVPGDRPRPSDDSPCRQRRYRRIRGCAGRPCVCVMCRPCSAGLATSANDRFGRHWHVDIAFTRAAGDIGMKDAGEDSVLTGRVGRDRFGWGIFDCAVG